MSNALTAAVIWLILLTLAVPYVRRIKHEDQKFLAAYLIFITAFVAVTYGLYMILVPLVGATSGTLATRPSIVVIVLTSCALVAVWIATLVARKPRLRPPKI